MAKFNLFLIAEDLFSHFFLNASIFDVFRQEPPSNLIYPREYTPSDSTQPYLTLIQQRISDMILILFGVLEIPSEMKDVGFFLHISV